jgi:hypothetical protein
LGFCPFSTCFQCVFNRFSQCFSGFSSGLTIEIIGFFAVRIDANIAKTLGFSLVSSAIARYFPWFFLGFQSASIAMAMLPKRVGGGLIAPLRGHRLAPSQSAPALPAHRGPATVRPVQTTRDRHRPHFGPRLADFPQFPWRNRNYSSPVLPIEGTIVPGRRSGKTRRAVGYLGSPLVTLAAMELVVDLQPRANPAHEPLGGSEKMNGFTLAIDHVLAVRLETGPPENPLELFPWKRPRLGDLVMAGSPCS